MKPLVIRLLAIGYFLGAASPAWAQQPDPIVQARQEWEAGRQLFQVGRYAGALEHFSRGYQLSQKGGFLFNMAECARLLGEKLRARGLYLSYLRIHGKERFRDQAIANCNALGQGDCTPSASGPAVVAPAVPTAPVVPVAPTPTPKHAAPPAGPTPPKTAVKPTRQPSAAAGVATPKLEAKAPYLPDEKSPGKTSPKGRPFYRHWGFWAGVGAAVVAGTVTAVVLATRSDSSLPAHDWLFDFRDK
ncbi:MAG: hypothetical protein H6707_18455 [Deltaproteobacteria bacterium]|nr:hypothetical protein [Deltaproteobacteria bacterium]